MRHLLLTVVLAQNHCEVGPGGAIWLDVTQRTIKILDVSNKQGLGIERAQVVNVI